MPLLHSQALSAVPDDAAQQKAPAPPPALQPLPGQPLPGQQPVYPASPAQPYSRPKVREAVVRDGEVSFHFDDADIFEVIQTVFGEVLKVNYTVDPKVKGFVNLRTAKPVKRENVLTLMEKILRLNGVGFVEDEGLYKIVPVGDVPSATPRVYVYPVQNSKAKNITSMLQQIFSAGHKAAKPADQPGAASVDAMVSETTRIFSDDVSNSIIVLSTPEDYVLIDEAIRKIDIVPRQVLIEGLIAEVSLTDNLSLGFAWSMKANLKDVGIDISGTAGQNLSDIAGIDMSKPLPGSGFTFVGADDEGIVRARIEALAKENKVKLLASPHILVSDNREARIQVGQQVPIVTSETPVTGTANIQRTIQYRDVGVILRVKPLVNEGGLVSLELTQEVSFVSGQVSGSTEVVLDKTEATTSLVSQDGRTIIIGGLIREDKSRDRTGIPLLSKIPILGYLFGRTSDNVSRRELLILLTPHVIRNQDEASRVTSEFVEKFKEKSKGAYPNGLLDKNGEPGQTAP